MMINKHIIETFHPLPPLSENYQISVDQRQFSKRWLAGIIFISITSTTLILSALFTTLDGRTQLATPPELLDLNIFSSLEQEKGNRIALTLPKQTFIDRQRLIFSKEERIRNKTITFNQPFEKLHMLLAQQRIGTFHYPKFNILDIFSDGVNAVPKTEELSISPLNEKEESKITLYHTALTIENKKDNNFYSNIDLISTEEAERNLHQNIFQLTNDLPLYNFIPSIPDQKAKEEISEKSDVKIIQENVSTTFKNHYDNKIGNYSEDILPLERNLSIDEILKKNGYKSNDFQALTNVLNQFFEKSEIKDGMILRLGFQQREDSSQMVRVSVYQNLNHIITIALDDNHNFVQASPPEITSILQNILKNDVPVRRISAKLPTVYDAIYRSVLSYNLPEKIAQQLVRILATDVDLERPVTKNATLDVLYPLKNMDQAEDNVIPKVLYVEASLGPIHKKYYRFQTEDGAVDYRDFNGHNAKQFLIRKPVPNGIFRSPFGIRRHPILGYVRMHTGVDWAAPRGSLIIAAGDGVITRIGTSRGYGNHTEIQHANGYMTTYSHQSGFAPGLKKGSFVKQGQIIGYVGSTGLSTGPHCHFEVIVNGTKVDPMRVRIPQSKQLPENELLIFQKERDKIDTLVSAANTHAVSDIIETKSD